MSDYDEIESILSDILGSGNTGDIPEKPRGDSYPDRITPDIYRQSDPAPAPRQASGRRVVFDEDNGVGAVRGGYRSERERREREAAMLRGDGYRPQGYVVNGRVVNRGTPAKPNVNPAYIDPLSDAPGRPPVGSDGSVTMTPQAAAAALSRSVERNARRARESLGLDDDADAIQAQAIGYDFGAMIDVEALSDAAREKVREVSDRAEAEVEGLVAGADDPSVISGFSLDVGAGLADEAEPRTMPEEADVKPVVEKKSSGLFSRLRKRQKIDVEPLEGTVDSGENAASEDGEAGEDDRRPFSADAAANAESDPGYSAAVGVGSDDTDESGSGQDMISADETQTAAGDPVDTRADDADKKDAPDIDEEAVRSSATEDDPERAAAECTDSETGSGDDTQIGEASDGSDDTDETPDIGADNALDDFGRPTEPLFVREPDGGDDPVSDPSDADAYDDDGFSVIGDPFVESSASDGEFEDISDPDYVELVPVAAAVAADEVSAPQEDKMKKKKRRSLGRVIRDSLPKKGDSAGEKIRKTIKMIAVLALIGALLYIAYFYVGFAIRKWIDARLNPTVFDDDATAWEQIKEKYPDVDFPEGMQIKWAELYAGNTDFVGKLTVPGTNISTVILRPSEDEAADLYLQHNYYKVYSRYGNPYLPQGNKIAIDGFDTNTIVFGHNMRQNVMMFSELTKYYDYSKDPVAGYKESPIIEFDTLFAQTKWKVFSVFVTNAEPSGDNGYYFDYLRMNFSDDDNYAAFLKTVLERSMIDTGVDVNQNDNILTLSTCVYDFNEARLVIMARLLRDGESEQVDLDAVRLNEDPRFPQAWYDVKGGVNKWRDAERWMP